MSSPIQNYLSKIPSDFTSSDPNFFSSTDMSLISLSHSLYNLSLISKEFQEVDYTPTFISTLDSSKKNAFFEEVIKLHKTLSHFILSHANESIDE